MAFKQALVLILFSVVGLGHCYFYRVIGKVLIASNIQYPQTGKVSRISTSYDYRHLVQFVLSQIDQQIVFSNERVMPLDIGQPAVAEIIPLLTFVKPSILFSSDIMNIAPSYQHHDGNKPEFLFQLEFDSKSPTCNFSMQPMIETYLETGNPLKRLLRTKVWICCNRYLTEGVMLTPVQKEIRNQYSNQFKINVMNGVTPVQSVPLFELQDEDMLVPQFGLHHQQQQPVRPDASHLAQQSPAKQQERAAIKHPVQESFLAPQQSAWVDQRRKQHNVSFLRPAERYNVQQRTGLGQLTQEPKIVPPAKKQRLDDEAQGTFTYTGTPVPAQLGEPEIKKQDLEHGTVSKHTVL